MTDLRKAAQQALEALKKSHPYSNSGCDLDKHSESIAALRAALAQPELMVGGDDLPRLTKWTPQRKPLTEEEIMQCFHNEVDAPVDVSDAEMIDFARAIEKAHGIGGES